MENDNFMKTILDIMPDELKKEYKNAQSNLIEKSPTKRFSYNIYSEESFAKPNVIAALYLMGNRKELEEFASKATETFSKREKENFDFIYTDSYHVYEMSLFIYGAATLVLASVSFNEDPVIINDIMEKYFKIFNGFISYNSFISAKILPEAKINEMMEKKYMEKMNEDDNKRKGLNVLRLLLNFNILYKALPFIPYGVIDEFPTKAIATGRHKYTRTDYGWNYKRTISFNECAKNQQKSR